jgi:hypothetical protein
MQGIPCLAQKLSASQETLCDMELSKGKGKAVPLEASGGPEGSRKLRFPDFLTTAQYGGKVASLSSPVTGLEWPRGFQVVKVPRFLDNGTGWW